ncbi:ArpU family phage packaging/lysis transcriptional regulator [Aneurinibacillus thermoaerophilus]|uniref:ArpU family phage packaging/lysis transcriptional regulator n=1 Tax=Aneurinibacillus thermoaerophilus TaxID=143495 RepID=UPI002E1B5FC3|nr:ArpU family phage packaging/lysis transcriptional regulator [Aneurinibacillus thermoaerophilus]MED0676973.1 ArpU family phage packaging/lysis transcriptional regulator [Aneurinibacillus thermoaerophilus]
MQMSFLPKINRKETQERVEDWLKIARRYRRFGTVRRETTLTPSYSPRYHGQTNRTSSPVEDCAVWNVDKEREMEEIAQLVEAAVSRLDSREREIIVKRYLEDDYTFDYVVYNELCISKRTYDRLKARAVYNLAFALKLEVYHGQTG